MEWIGYIGIGILVLLVLLVLVTNIQIVQQSRAYVVERLGAYSATWSVGLHFKIPFFERVVKKVSLKEQVADFDPQPVITKDNVTMQIDTVIYFQITDPRLYTYGVEYPMNAIENLTATTLRNIFGELELDQSLTSRDTINAKMRIPGYEAALKEAGQALDEALIFEAHDSYREGYDLTEKVLASGAKAAFVSDDGIAAGLLNGLTDHGVKVPADFELIAANDTKLTEITRPKMTSVTQPLYDIGAVSIRLLTKLMGNNQATDGEDGDDEQNVILPHGFEERQTTR